MLYTLGGEHWHLQEYHVRYVIGGNHRRAAFYHCFEHHKADLNVALLLTTGLGNVIDIDSRTPDDAVMLIRDEDNALNGVGARISWIQRVNKVPDMEKGYAEFKAKAKLDEHPDRNEKNRKGEETCKDEYFAKTYALHYDSMTSHKSARSFRNYVVSIGVWDTITELTTKYCRFSAPEVVNFPGFIHTFNEICKILLGGKDKLIAEWVVPALLMAMPLTRDDIPFIFKSKEDAKFLLGGLGELCQTNAFELSAPLDDHPFTRVKRVIASASAVQDCIDKETMAPPPCKKAKTSDALAQPLVPPAPLVRTILTDLWYAIGNSVNGASDPLDHEVALIMQCRALEFIKLQKTLISSNTTPVMCKTLPRLRQTIVKRLRLSHTYPKDEKTKEQVDDGAEFDGDVPAGLTEDGLDALAAAAHEARSKGMERLADAMTSLNITSDDPYVRVNAVVAKRTSAELRNAIAAVWSNIESLAPTLDASLLTQELVVDHVINAVAVSVSVAFPDAVIRFPKLLLQSIAEGTDVCNVDMNAIVPLCSSFLSISTAMRGSIVAAINVFKKKTDFTVILVEEALAASYELLKLSKQQLAIIENALPLVQLCFDKMCAIDSTKYAEGAVAWKSAWVEAFMKAHHAVTADKQTQYQSDIDAATSDKLEGSARDAQRDLWKAECAKITVPAIKGLLETEFPAEALRSCRCNKKKQCGRLWPLYQKNCSRRLFVAVRGVSMQVPNEMQGFALAAGAFLLQLGVSICKFEMKCKVSHWPQALFVPAWGVNMRVSNEMHGFALTACVLLLQLGV